MPRVRQRPHTTTGSFAVSAGAQMSMSRRVGKKSTIGVSAGAQLSMAGVRFEGGSSTFEVGLDTAQILLNPAPTYTYMQEVKNHMDRYGGIGAMRNMKLFNGGQLNIGMTSWTNSTSILKMFVDMWTAGNAAQKAALAQMNPVLCFKSYTQASFDAAMTAIPSWMNRVTYVYQQEADRSSNTPTKGSPWPVQDYLNVYAQMNARRLLHANANKVYLLKNLTHGGVVRQNNGANVKAYDYHGIGWTWTPGNPTVPSTTGQMFDHLIFGWDVYDEKSLTNQNGYYPTGVEMFGSPNRWRSDIPSMIEQIQTIGLPWCIPELGITITETPPNGPYNQQTVNMPEKWFGFRSPWDIPAGVQYKGDYPDGTRRTAAIADWMLWLKNNGCLWANYWCANGTEGTPIKYYHLDIGSNTAAPLWIDHEFPATISLLQSYMKQLVARP